jgi:hypothetical protein
MAKCIRIHTPARFWVIICRPQSPSFVTNHASLGVHRAVLKEELGAYPEELWSQFEEKSIASASLAQVAYSLPIAKPTLQTCIQCKNDKEAAGR